MLDFVKKLNSIKSILEINSFNLLKMDNDFFKIILDFNIIDIDILNEFLKDLEFNKKVLYCNEGED